MMIAQIPSTMLINHLPTVLDLFCGAGGTAWGFLKAGFNIIGAIDNNPVAIKTYERNIGIKPQKADLQEIKGKDLLQLLNLRPYELDVMVGCPPCQGFTGLRGVKGADDPRNSLVDNYLEFVEVLRPRCVVFENVPGINRNHGKKFFNSLKSGLIELGYAFDTHHAETPLNAADYGVPQIRERVVLLAGRDGKVIPYPEPTHARPDTLEVGAGLLKPWVTVRDEIGNLPPLQPGEKHETIHNHHTREMKERVTSFIKRVPKDGGSRTDVPQEYWLECHKKAGCGHYDVYGRLAWDRPAIVMTTGCTNVSKGRFVHPDQDRGISFREAARLQSFKDDFVFEGNMEEVATQIGNAVPPLLAKAIADSIKQWLCTEEKMSVTSTIRPINFTAVFSEALR